MKVEPESFDIGDYSRDPGNSDRQRRQQPNSMLMPFQFGAEGGVEVRNTAEAGVERDVEESRPPHPLSTDSRSLYASERTFDDQTPVLCQVFRVTRTSKRPCFQGLSSRCSREFDGRGERI